EFSQKRGELVAGLLPHQHARVADDLLGLRIAAFAKVAEEPRAQVLRLADIDEPAAGVDHAIDAGRARGMIANTLLQSRGSLAAQLTADDCFIRWTKTRRAEALE